MFCRFGRDAARRALRDESAWLDWLSLFHRHGAADYRCADELNSANFGGISKVRHCTFTIAARMDSRERRLQHFARPLTTKDLNP
jgi:hypothetical protein